MLRTDVSKEFLELEGKQSRKNPRNTRQILNNENMIMPTNSPNFMNSNEEKNDNGGGHERADFQMRRDLEMGTAKLPKKLHQHERHMRSTSHLLPDQLNFWLTSPPCSMRRQCLVTSLAAKVK